ncbi:hypothetical protein K1W69_20125 [Hoeflea sp. WL0058]|uniref:Flavodoxin domain-containing protein n=1 Tax=Flavimaribacter sediminis TaxID=2865987 RepID=A0AAE2ZTU4_9HYPH|nr:flavodoxin domain-containing protein [Flavimaribacter sediminis]MBW8639512.1 hypothetical protein [Flavimaribacter sediminis]
MNILVIFATTEGHTAKIAKFVVAELKELGHTASSQDADAYLGGQDPADFDAVILAGSVHANRHQEMLGAFIAAHRKTIDAKKSLLLSVSLSAAFEKTLAEAEGYVKDFCEELDWRPDDYLLVSGAIKHDSYGYYEEMILQDQVLPGRPVQEPDQDQELTNWEALKKSIADFAGKAG